MERFKKYISPVLMLIVTAVCSVLVTKSCSKPKIEERVVAITDTITNVEFDTVFLKEIKTEKLHTTDTFYVLRDSIFEVVDSVNVEVPVTTYKFDEIFENDSVKLKIGIECSGYDVMLERFNYDLQYKYKTVQLQKPTRRFGFFIGPVVGFGVESSGKVVPAIGFGCGIGISLKKW